MGWESVPGCVNCGCGNGPCSHPDGIMGYRRRYRLTITSRTCPAFWDNYSVILFDYAAASEWLPEPFPAPPIACNGIFEIFFTKRFPISLYPMMSGRNQRCTYFCGGFLEGDPTIYGIYVLCDGNDFRLMCDGSRWNWLTNLTQVAEPPFMQLRNVPVCYNCDEACVSVPQRNCLIDITITEYIP